MAFFKTTKIKYVTLDPAINNFLGEFNFTCGEFFVQLPFPCFFLLSAATLKKKILRNIVFFSIWHYYVKLKSGSDVRNWDYLVSSKTEPVHFFFFFDIGMALLSGTPQN